MNKTCPSCKYEKCFHKASRCEKCGYDFLTRKKPKKRIKREEPLPILVPEKYVEPPPKPVGHKKCPYCGYDKVFVRASRCEKCGSDLLAPPPEPPKVIPQQQVLLAPNWEVFCLDWLHEIEGGYHPWVHRTVERFHALFGTSLAPWSLTELARNSPNPKLQILEKDIGKSFPLPHECGGLFHFLGFFLCQGFEHLGREKISLLMKNRVVLQLVKKAKAKL